MRNKVKFEVSAGGVVFKCKNHKPEVILCRHKTFNSKDVWSLPKGWVEPGEKIVAAALREVKEESGLEGEVVEKIDTIQYWFFHPLEKVRVKKRVHFFLIKAAGGNISQHDYEVDEVKWFPVEEALKRCAYKGEKEVLTKVAVKLRELCA